jgi:hypothetical protein
MNLFTLYSSPEQSKALPFDQEQLLNLVQGFCCFTLCAAMLLSKAIDLAHSAL